MVQSNFKPGQLVHWNAQPSEGYGSHWLFKAVVVKVCPKRVTIDVELAKGGFMRKSVPAKNLRIRTE